MMKFVAAIALTTVLLYAPQAAALGANSDRNLKEFTAQRVMEDTHRQTNADEITLINVRRGMFRVT